MLSYPAGNVDARGDGLALLRLDAVPGVVFADVVAIKQFEHVHLAVARLTRQTVGTESCRI